MFVKNHIVAPLFVIASLILIANVNTGCGTKDPEEIAIVLQFDESNNPFNATGLADIIFLVAFVDNSEATIVFPTACVSDGTLLNNCGFTVNEEQFRLDLDPEVPEGSIINVTIQGRTESGTTVFDGTSENFTNSKDTSQVTINVTLSS